MKKGDPRLLQGARHALVVMDQPILAKLVCLALTHGGYVSRVVRDAGEAASVEDEWRPHLAVVDMAVATRAMLGRLGLAPNGDDHVPVIALTRRGDLQSTLDAFAKGVDDVLAVPFSPDELVARAVAVTRRTYDVAAVALTPVLQLDDLQLDIVHRRVSSGTAGHELTSLEQGLLYLLAANAGRPLTRAEILDVLWGSDYAPERHMVDRLVRALRAKLPRHASRPFISTVPRQGYCLVATARAEDQKTAAAI